MRLVLAHKRHYDSAYLSELRARRKAAAKKQSEAMDRLDQLNASDGWLSDPSKVPAYIATQNDEARYDRQIRDLDREISVQESLNPQVVSAKPGDTETLSRFMRSGFNGLEEHERKNLEPSEVQYEAIGINNKSAEAIVLDKLPAYSVEERARHLYAAQVASDVSTGDGAAQAAQPIRWEGDLIQRLDYYGGVAKVCRQYDTPDTIVSKFPQMDDTEAGEVITTQRAAATEGDFGLSTVDIEAYRGSSKYVDVGNELFRNLGYLSLETVVRNILLRRIGRAWDAWATANANSTGVFDIATSAFNLAATTPTHAEMVNLVHSIDRAYREGEMGDAGFNMRGEGQRAFVLTDTMERNLKTVLDNSGGAGTGRPAWQRADEASMALGFPGMIFGYPYVVAGSRAHAGNAVNLLYGNFSYYVCRNAGPAIMFRFFDSGTANTYSTRFLAFRFRGMAPVQRQYGSTPRYEFLAAATSP